MDARNGEKAAVAIELVEKFLIKRSTRHAYIVKSWMQANVTGANWHDLEIKLHEEGFSPMTVDELHEEMVQTYTRGQINGEWLLPTRESPAEDTSKTVSAVAKTVGLVDYISVVIFLLASALTAFGLTVLANPTEKKYVIFSLIFLALTTAALTGWVNYKLTKYYIIRRKLRHYSREVWLPRFRRLILAAVCIFLMLITGSVIAYHYRWSVMKNAKQVWAKIRNQPEKPTLAYNPPPQVPPSTELPAEIFQVSKTELAQEIQRKNQALEEKLETISQLDSEVAKLRSQLEERPKRQTPPAATAVETGRIVKNTTETPKIERRKIAKNESTPNKVEISVSVNPQQMTAIQKLWADRLEKTPR